MKKINFRTANFNELPQIIRLLADDELGKVREEIKEVVGPQYEKAFKEIEQDPNNEIIVGVYGTEVIAVLQMTYIPGLTLKGMTRAQIEGVRVASTYRSKGVGKLLFEFAFEQAKKRGCGLVQLTTNKSRPRTIRFYEKMGFSPTHEGMKLVPPANS